MAVSCVTDADMTSLISMWRHFQCRHHHLAVLTCLSAFSSSTHEPCNAQRPGTHRNNNLSSKITMNCASQHTWKINEATILTIWYCLLCNVTKNTSFKFEDFVTCKGMAKLTCVYAPTNTEIRRSTCACNNVIIFYDFSCPFKSSIPYHTTALCCCWINFHSFIHLQWYSCCLFTLKTLNLKSVSMMDFPDESYHIEWKFPFYSDRRLLYLFL